MKLDYNDYNIDPGRIPAHVAIIMDGNGRWAKKRGLPHVAGHNAGMSSLKETVRAASDIGVRHLTVYAFSTENWKRSDDEIKGIFKIMLIYLEKEIRELHKNNVRLNIIGDYSRLPGDVVKKLESAVEYTKNNTGLQLNVALNYGGRNEIVRAMKSIGRMIEEGKADAESITEELVSSMLYTSDIPDPDLIIRTSGEMRLSNFLLWQSAYSEFWFTDVLWPDFSEAELLRAIADFQNRNRRYGGR